MFTLSPLSFFNELSFTPHKNVFVVSDSQYASYQKQEAQKQINQLQARAVEYEKALANITSTIDGLKQEHGLIEPATQPEA
jgi:hypothetical protein